MTLIPPQVHFIPKPTPKPPRPKTTVASGGAEGPSKAAGTNSHRIHVLAQLLGPSQGLGTVWYLDSTQELRLLGSLPTQLTPSTRTSLNRRPAHLPTSGKARQKGACAQARPELTQAQFTAVAEVAILRVLERSLLNSN